MPFSTLLPSDLCSFRQRLTVASAFGLMKRIVEHHQKSNDQLFVDVGNPPKGGFYKSSFGQMMLKE